MSETDKDAIIGRAVREEKQLRLELGLQDKVLKDVVQGLDELKEGIRSRTGIFHPVRDKLALPVDLSKYSDFAAIVAALNDRLALHEKLREAEATLVRLGIRESSIHS